MKSIQIREGYMDFAGHKTYYRIVNPDGKKTPLLLLHGGPGSTHNYFEVLDSLAEAGRPIVFYDQIGCGKSMVDGGPELFNAETWLGELVSIREHLGLDSVHILGQSWGGMLAIWYAIERRPIGVKSYILSSTLSSAKLWEEEQHRQISYMPPHMQSAIRKALETGDYEDKDYLDALAEFMERHSAPDLSRDPRECLSRPRKSGTKSYITGWGPNEFTPTGTLSDYEFTDRLKEIKTPCLVISGQRDLSTPYIAKTMVDALPDARWELFQHSRHIPFVEETEKYIRVVSEFMNSND